MNKIIHIRMKGLNALEKLTEYPVNFSLFGAVGYFPRNEALNTGELFGSNPNSK